MSIVAHQFVSISLLVFFLVGSAGCQQRQAKAPTKSQTVATPSGESEANSSEESLVGKLVTGGEYYDAARLIEQDALRTSTELGRHYDMEAIYDFAMKDFDVSPTFRKNFKKGALEKGGGVQLAERILSETEEEGSYRLLHVHRRGEDYFALFRLLFPAGVNYHNLKLVKDDQGRILVKDIYVLASGEYMSETMRRMLVPAVAHANRNLVQRFTQSDEELLAQFKKFQEITVAGQAGEHEQVCQIYASMPKSMQELKPVQITRVSSASQAHDAATFRAAMADYRRLYPRDRAIDIVILEMLIQDKKFGAALEAIDRVDQFVGIDPYLDTHRAVVHSAAGNLAEAERLYIKATGDPTALPGVYWQLIPITIARNDFDKTLKYLLEAEHRYSLELDDLKTIPEYAPFVASPQYQQWLQRNEKPPE